MNVFPNFRKTMLKSFGNTLNPVYVFGKLEVIFHYDMIPVEAGTESYGRMHIFTYQPRGKVSVGSYTSIAEIEILIGGNHHRGVSTFPFKSRLLFEPSQNDNLPAKDVVIGNDCWIGKGVSILEGAIIGTGSIIGAGSVISKSVTPYSIVVGNPARTVGKRFDDYTIARLLETKWWELPRVEIVDKIDLFYGDVENFLRKIQE